MSGPWAAKRFWTAAEPAQADGGWTITLDGRPVRTPAKVPLVVPSRSLAKEIAAEWQAQTETIDPTTMPYTRTANAAIDKVATQHGEVADLLAAYGDSDLLCYRADAPEGLVARQAEGWDPLLDWLATSLEARLVLRVGVMHAPQSPEALARLTGYVHAMSAFELAAFHDLVSLSGSLVLALAVVHDRLTPEAAWTLSRIDESWQEDHWGTDDEASEHAAIKRAAFLHAARFYALASTDHSLSVGS